MTNDQFFLSPMPSYGHKNTVGAVARLFFSDSPLTPHANIRQDNQVGNRCYVFLAVILCMCVINLREWIAKSTQLRNIRQDDQVGNRCHVF